MSNIKKLIAETVKQELHEVLRGFSLKQFKDILKKARNPDKNLTYKFIKQDDAIEYVKKHLPLLGQGTSRIVFALSGDKVLKIAHRKTLAGEAQNEQEVNLYTNPDTKPVMTKIYDADDEYFWIISELAKPFSSASEFSAKTGLNADVMDDFEKTCEEYGKLLWDETQDFGYFTVDPIDEVNSLEETVEWCKKNLKGTPAEHAVHLAKNGAAAGDLGPYDHWGTTADGRVVVVDYGLTSEIHQKYY